jgi:DNA repair exonuclease SbcCD ATPase subunit
VKFADVRQRWVDWEMARWMPWALAAVSLIAIVMSRAGLVAENERQMQALTDLSGQIQELRHAQATPGTLSQLQQRIAQIEEGLEGLKNEIASLRTSIVAEHEKIMAVQASLKAVRASIDALSEAPEPPAPVAATEPDASLVKDVASHNADLQALAVVIRTLADQVAALSNKPAAPPSPTPPPAVPANGNRQQVDGLEHASTAALATLDQRLERLSAGLNALGKTDQDLSQAVEHTRVALESQLVEWRERLVPRSGI